MAKKEKAPAAEKVEKIETKTDVLVVIQEKVRGMQSMLDNSPVTNDEQLAAVSDKIKTVKQLAKYIEQEKDKYVAPAKAIIATAKEKYDPQIKVCENAEITLKTRANSYLTLKENERKEKEAKIIADAEAGKISETKAVAKMEKLPEERKAVVTPTSTLRRSVHKVAKIVNPELVPKEYWVIDEVKVKKVALAGVAIPGVEIVEETRVSSY